MNVQLFNFWFKFVFFTLISFLPFCYYRFFIEILFSAFSSLLKPSSYRISLLKLFSFKGLVLCVRWMQVSWWCRKRAEDSNRIEIKNIGAVGENTSTKNGVLRLLLGLGGTPGGSKAEFWQCSRKCDAQKTSEWDRSGRAPPTEHRRTCRTTTLTHSKLYNIYYAAL